MVLPGIRVCRESSAEGADCGEKVSRLKGPRLLCRAPWGSCLSAVSLCENPRAKKQLSGLEASVWDGRFVVTSLETEIPVEAPTVRLPRSWEVRNRYSEEGSQTSHRLAEGFCSPLHPAYSVTVCCLSQAQHVSHTTPSAWEVSLKLGAEHAAVLRGFPAGVRARLSLQCDSDHPLSRVPMPPCCAAPLLCSQDPSLLASSLPTGTKTL
ncbi:uncharacterized protein LOC122450966 [Cervus canadensis]|uniref:uncharacterized protein LOC122450966 n=1 Tax=Cervus canadensis TaxID=1574408 RepID=UPI001C9E52EF|nr:uncharacterized protein LOC122450966 [Cervus canadensis]